MPELVENVTLGDEIVDSVCSLDLVLTKQDVALISAAVDERLIARVQRLEALVSWIDGRCVDFSTTPHAAVLAGEIRAAINRYREEQG
jgi:hypothetical protein